MIRLQSDSLYNNVIQQFIALQISGTTLNNTVLLNSLEEAFYANKDVRLGAKPDVEHLYRVRRIFDKYISKRAPIPVLTPWGSKKGLAGHSIDMAEFMAIVQLINLNERVKKIYPYGIHIRLRLEDLTGYKVYEGDDGDVVEDTQMYVNDMKRLIKILGANFIEPVIETEEFKGDTDTFFSKIDVTASRILDYLVVTKGLDDTERAEPRYTQLMPSGWKGIISKEMVGYYEERYSRIYPNETDLFWMKKLATYFASAYIRNKEGLRGDKSEWEGDYIQLTFVPPVSGLPVNYDLNYVYYRTIPEKYCRTHLMPWRGKGFFQIKEDIAIPKITTWYDPKEMYEDSMMLIEGNDCVKVATPYILV